MRNLLIVGYSIALLNDQPIPAAIWRNLNHIDCRAIAAIGKRNAFIGHIDQHRHIVFLGFICLPIEESHPQIARPPEDPNGVLVSLERKHGCIDRVSRRRGRSWSRLILLGFAHSIRSDRTELDDCP